MIAATTEPSSRFVACYVTYQIGNYINTASGGEEDTNRVEEIEIPISSKRVPMGRPAHLCMLAGAEGGGPAAAGRRRRPMKAAACMVPA